MNRHLLGFQPATFSRRRDRVREQLRGGVLVLPAAPVLRRSRETEHRYRPDSELFYLTGCVEPEVVAVFRGEGEDSFSLFMPRRDPESEMWSGPRMGPEEAQELFRADSVHLLDEMEDLLPGLLQAHERVFFRLGRSSRVENLVTGALEWARNRGQREGKGPRAVEDPGQILDDLRLLKDPEEITRIRTATTLTAGAFEETLAGTRPGMGEWDVEALLESSFRRGGAEGAAFPTIVGSGRNGCILHYVDNRASIHQDDLVLLDGGAEIGLYSGDVTRTYPAGGRFTPRQREVYEIVRRAHGAAISQLRPGSTLAQVHEAALEALIDGLVDLEVLSGKVGDLLEAEAYKPYFPHRTSHWLGLDVHDVGDYASNGRQRVLEPGMVLTVEPGLYFSPVPGARPNPFEGIGVRIEDDILVTEDGAENLTGSLPVSPEEVEALAGAGPKG